MPKKQKITITVAGPAGSGKSTLMALIANNIGAYDIQVVQKPFPGEPTMTSREFGARMAAIADRIQVEIVEEASRVRATSPTRGRDE